MAPAGSIPGASKGYSCSAERSLPVTLLDQLAHGIPAPQCVLELELVRSIVANELLDLSLLLMTEEAVVALATFTLLLLHRDPAALLILFSPLAYSLTGNIQIISYCLLGPFLLQHLDRLACAALPGPADARFLRLCSPSM